MKTSVKIMAINTNEEDQANASLIHISIILRLCLYMEEMATYDVLITSTLPNIPSSMIFQSNSPLCRHETNDFTSYISPHVFWALLNHHFCHNL